MASLSRSLWHRNRVLAEAALEHLFVQGIASGELARATFAHYVGQDAVFLDAFCRAYALGLAKSPDREGVIAFRELLDAAADELRLHNGYAARWGVDLHQAADPATSAYTDFLLAVAAVEPVGHIAAAMTPCMRLYAYLGQQLAAHTKPESPYREWVETYSRARSSRLWRDVWRFYSTATEVTTTAWLSCITGRWSSNCGSSTPPADGRSPDRGCVVDRNAVAWQAATVHPFLAGVRDGSVPADSFDRWLAALKLLEDVSRSAVADSGSCADYAIAGDRCGLRHRALDAVGDGRERRRETNRPARL